MKADLQLTACIGMRKLRECSLSESPERPLESTVRTREGAVSACLFYPEIFRAQNRSSITNSKLQIGSDSNIPSEFSTLQSMAIQIIAKQKEIQNTTHHQNGFFQWRQLPTKMLYINLCIIFQTLSCVICIISTYCICINRMLCFISFAIYTIYRCINQSIHSYLNLIILANL